MANASRVSQFVRRAMLLAALGTLTACLGDLAQPRGVVGEAAIDLRGLRTARQTAGDTSDEVQSARFAVYLISGGVRREVASRVFTARDINVSDSESGTTFTITFPYSSPDDKFEVEGRGFSAQGDTLYRVGPVAFTMRNATAQGGQAVVSVVTPPIYVGPGKVATRVEITPRAVTTVQGRTTNLAVTLYDGSGNALSSPTFRFNWWTNDGSVARFMDDRLGVVTGGERPGSAWLYVRFDPMNLQDSVRVTNGVTPAQIRLVDGGGQSGPVGAALSKPVQVQVLSSNGTPLPGITVSFAVAAGGGSVSAASRVTSSPDGAAQVTWTLGAALGTQSLTVSVPGIPSLNVSATATAGTPSASQSSVSVLPTAIEVGGDEAVVTATLRDNAGNPVPNYTVTFSGPSGLVFTSPTVQTSSTGVATTRVHATLAGTFQIFVVGQGATLGSVSLAVGSQAGIPASISIVSGDNQTVKIGQNFPLPLVVVVKDASGHPVSGALVDWGTAVGDGRKVTDSNGQSSATYYLTANWPAGTGTVTVALTGYGKTAVFTYAAVP